MLYSLCRFIGGVENADLGGAHTSSGYTHFGLRGARAILRSLDVPLRRALTNLVEKIRSSG